MAGTMRSVSEACRANQGHKRRRPPWVAERARPTQGGRRREREAYRSRWCGESDRDRSAAMAAGDWQGARAAFRAVLEVSRAPAAFFGLAHVSFWLGDLKGTITNCEQAYAGSAAAAIRRSRPPQR